MIKILSVFLLIIISIPYVSSAHYIVGIVNNAKDGTTANDKTVVLWNPSIGISDNVTDIIGINGNSLVNNIYMIDCELLNDSCKPGDDLLIMVIDNGLGYIGNNASAKVTGKGYNEASNISLNSPPNITSIAVDDDLINPLNEIDLVSSSYRLVNCIANVSEADGSSLLNVTSQFYDISNSYYMDSDDNNTHYTNNSCYINQSYNGITSKRVICSYNVWYYANPNNWRCIIKLEDNLSISRNSTDDTFINQLLSIGIADILDYNPITLLEVSSEKVLNVTNFGNVMINLSLSGYGLNEGDNLSMDCTSLGNGNISINHEKYNLTNSNPGLMDLSEFESKYLNLTSNPIVNKFNLDYRQNEAYNEAVNGTYWRIYVPSGIGGRCNGNIVVSAILAPEI